jgi:hypothetical protein
MHACCILAAAVLHYIVQQGRSTTDIVAAYKKMLRQMRTFNSNMKVVVGFTFSPSRSLLTILLDDPVILLGRGSYKNPKSMLSTTQFWHW